MCIIVDICQLLVIVGRKEQGGGPGVVSDELLGPGSGQRALVEDWGLHSSLIKCKCMIDGPRWKTLHHLILLCFIQRVQYSQMPPPETPNP